MRRILGVFLLLLVASLSGCLGGDEKKPQGSNEPTATPTSTSTTPTSSPTTPRASHTATLTAQPASGSVPLDANFTVGATGADAYTTWRLAFGDGATKEGTGVPGHASHTYATQGDFTATVTVTFSDGATAMANATVRVEAAAPQQTLPEVTHFEYGPSAGCAGDFLQLAGLNCVSVILGPEQPAIDGFWQALDETYWGLNLTSTVANVQGDSDCFFADPDLVMIGEANNGAGSCAGAVPEGTAWMFLYSYAEPATSQTVDFFVPE